MKKIFIVAMALAAFVSCSKDDGVDKVLTSKEKSVSVTIQNSVISGTRAVVKGSDAEFTPEAIGGEAGLTDQVGTTGADGETETLVADLGTLQILFANQAGQVLHAMPLVNEADDDIHAGENGTNEDNEPNQYVPGENDGEKVGGGVYTFHRVPEAVTRIAVIRDTKVLAGQALEGQTLASIQAWALEEEEARELDVQNIFLYAEGDLAPSDDECYVDKVNGVETKYYFYTTTLNIEPQYTRFELVSVSCDDLGKYNNDVTEAGEDNIATVGLDELELVKFTIPLNGKDYTKTWEAGTILYGGACAGAEKCGKDKSTKVTAGENLAWSWNMAPGKLALGTAPMVLDLNADSHHMFVNNPAKTVRVVKLNTTADFALDKGKVYRMELEFSEDNIDETDDQLCVEATVKIADWTVVLVKPEFGNN